MRSDKYIGLQGPDGELVWASDCNSQIEGTNFDGPVLWPDLDTAKRENDEFGGVPKGHQLVSVSVVVFGPAEESNA
jgi:hypothetical protein